MIKEIADLIIMQLVENCKDKETIKFLEKRLQYDNKETEKRIK